MVPLPGPQHRVSKKAGHSEVWHISTEHSQKLPLCDTNSQRDDPLVYRVKLYNHGAESWLVSVPTPSRSSWLTAENKRAQSLSRCLVPELELCA